MAHGDGALGAQSVHALNGLAEDLLVEEDEGVERLILGAGRDLALAGELGQEVLELLSG